MDRLWNNLTFSDELHEECGVFGAYDLEGGDIANWVSVWAFCAAARSGKLPELQ